MGPAGHAFLPCSNWVYWRTSPLCHLALSHHQPVDSGSIFLAVRGLQWWNGIWRAVQRDVRNRTRTTGVASALQIGRGLAFIPPIITAAIFPVYGYAPVVLMGAAEFGLLAIWAWVFKETRNKSILQIDAERGSSAQVMSKASNS